MSERPVLQNPRRSPRTRVRCAASVRRHDGSAFAAETVDVSPRGCQLVTPVRLDPRTAISLELRHESVPVTLRAVGRVAWVSDDSPWRVGIELLEGSVGEATAWCAELLRAGAAAPPAEEVRLAVDAPVWLGRPPRALVDFTADELEVLSLVGNGLRVAELVRRLAGRWERAQHAFFSLLARRCLTLSRGASFPPSAWRDILGEPAPFPAPPAAAPVPEPPPPAAPPPAATPEPPAGSAGAVLPVAAPIEAFLPAGGDPGDRAAAMAAAACYERALAEADAGRTGVAVALLRQALGFAPGDPDVADALGKLVFQDSTRRR